MATLDPSNVINGNTIEASDIAQLYKAFGTGSGADITGLSMTGSLYGNALTATSATTASTATTASYVTTAITGGGTHYLTFVNESPGVRPLKVASLLEYTPSNNNLQVTASFATTASYANDASVTQVNNQPYVSLSMPSPVSSGDFKFIAGAGILSGGELTSSDYPVLLGKTLGENVFINASYTGDPGTIISLSPTLVINLSILGEVLIEQLDKNDDCAVMWTGFYI